MSPVPEIKNFHPPMLLFQWSQLSSIDKVITGLAGAILSGDLFVLGLVFFGVITLPFTWHMVLLGSAVIGIPATIVLVFAARAKEDASDQNNEVSNEREEEFERSVDLTRSTDDDGFFKRQIDHSNDGSTILEVSAHQPKSPEDDGFVLVEIDDPDDDGAGLEKKVWVRLEKPKTQDKEKEEDLGFVDVDSEVSEDDFSPDYQASLKKGAIAKWQSIGEQTTSLPLLEGSCLDVFFEAFCKNQNQNHPDAHFVDSIAQSSPNGQSNDIVNYQWQESQKYLVFGLGIQALGSSNPLTMVSHLAGGGSIEGHQTLVVIDQSDAEEPILWFYDPKGREPNDNQKDAMAPNKTIPERLQEIQESFEKKFSKKIQRKQLHVGKLPNLRGDAHQSIFNKNYCVYLCAGVAMDIVLNHQSDFSGDPRKIAQKVIEELDRAFPNSSQSSL